MDISESRKAISADMISGGAGILAEVLTGGISGGLAGVTIKSVVSDIVKRTISTKQLTRVNNLQQIGYSLTEKRMANGDVLRSDDFFEQINDQPSSAEEIFEGVFYIAMNSYQERKIQHLAHLLTNIAFDETCKHHDADRFLRLAESLSYTQFILMKLFFTNLDNKYDLRTGDYESGIEISDSTETILSLSYSLVNNGLIYLPFNDDPKFSATVVEASAINPSTMKLTSAGERFYKLLSLDLIDNSDVLEINNLLK